MPSLTSLAALVVASLAAATLALASQDTAPAAAGKAPPPSSLVPAPRTDAGSIARQDELVRRARESEPVDILFVGDSITQAWEGPGKAAWDTHLAPLGALNLGNSGDRTENVLWRLHEAPLSRLQAKHVFLLIGTNNLGHGTSNADETLLGVKAVAEMLAAQCEGATIHIIEIFPRGERINPMRGDICQINQALRAFVTERNAKAGKSGARFAIHPIGDRFLDADGVISRGTMPDFLHLTPAAAGG